MKLDLPQSFRHKSARLQVRQSKPAPCLVQYSGRPGWRVVARCAAVLLVAAFCFVYGAAFSLVAPALLPIFTIPILVLGLLVVWALPDQQNPPIRILESLFFAFFICLALWPDYLAISLPGLPWITLLRLTGFPMAFFLLVSLSTSADFRRSLATTARAAFPVTFLLVAFVALQLTSIALSANKGLSVQKFFIAQTNWTAVFFTAAYLFRKPERLELWMKLFWGTAIVVSIIAVWEFRLKHVPWAGHIPSFLKIEDESVAKTLAGTMRAFTSRYRAQATFGTSLGLAEYLVLAMPFVLQFAAGPYDARLRLSATASIPIMFYAVILTESRLGLIGSLLSFLFFGLVVAARKWLRNRTSILGPAATLSYPALFVLAVTGSFAVARLRVKIWGGGAQQPSTLARFEQYQLGFPKIAHNPLGYGAGMAAQTLGYAPYGELTIDAYYLSIALEYGVIGFLLYYAMIVVAIFHAGRGSFNMSSPSGQRERLFVPMAIALTNFLVIKSVFSQQDNHPVIFMILGAIVALCAAPEQCIKTGSFSPATSIVGPSGALTAGGRPPRSISKT